MVVLLFVISSIGAIDVYIERFEDMAAIIHNEVDTKVYGILVKDNDEVAVAIQAYIILEVDVIAMPIQMWQYSVSIARMIASANGRGIIVVAAGTNDRWFHDAIIERIKKAAGGRLQRHIGVEYMDRTFRRSASYNCVLRAAQLTRRGDGST